MGGKKVELKKQISCSLQLSNKTDNYVAFKVSLVLGINWLIYQALDVVFDFFNWGFFLGQNHESEEVLRSA